MCPKKAGGRVANKPLNGGRNRNGKRDKSVDDDKPPRKQGRPPGPGTGRGGGDRRAGQSCMLEINNITRRQLISILAITTYMDSMDHLAVTPDGENLTFGYDFRDSCRSLPCGLSQTYSLTYRRTEVKEPATPAVFCAKTKKRFDCAVRNDTTREKFRLNTSRQQIAPASVMLGGGQSGQLQYLFQVSNWSAPTVGYTMEMTFDRIMRSFGSKGESYAHFMPTPSDAGEAIYDVLVHFNWSYVGLVTVLRNDYMAATRTALLKAIRRGKSSNRICLAVDESVSPTKSGVYKTTTEKLYSKPKVRVVVFLGNEAQARTFVDEVRRPRPDRNFGRMVYIGILSSTMTGGKLLEKIPADNEQNLFLFLAPVSTRWAQKESRRALQKMRESPETIRIPHHLRPYWSEFFRCSFCNDSHPGNVSSRAGSIEDAMLQPALHCRRADDVCSDRLRHFEEYCNGTEVAVTNEEVVIMARFTLPPYFDGLRLVTGAIRRAFPKSVDWNTTRQAIKIDRVAVQEALKAEVAVMRAEVNYTRLFLGVLRRRHNGSALKLAVVGNWRKKDEQHGAKSSLVMTGMRIPWGVGRQAPLSQCMNSSLECNAGTERFYERQDEPCCYTCRPCPEHFNSSGGEATSRCERCPEDMTNNSLKTRCEPLKADYSEWSDPLAVMCTILVSLCTVLVLSTMIIYTVWRHTHVIRTADLTLSAALLVSLLLSQMTKLVYNFQPDDPFACVWQVALPYPPQVAVLASLLMKTRRIAMIFAASLTQLVLRKENTSVRYQVRPTEANHTFKMLW